MASVAEQLASNINLGAIAKAYAAPQKLEDLSMGEVPAVVDLYVLGYDSTKKLNTSSTGLGIDC